MTIDNNNHNCSTPLPYLFSLGVTLVVFFHLPLRFPHAGHRLAGTDIYGHYCIVTVITEHPLDYYSLTSSSSRALAWHLRQRLLPGGAATGAGMVAARTSAPLLHGTCHQPAPDPARVLILHGYLAPVCRCRHRAKTLVATLPARTAARSGSSP